MAAYVDHGLSLAERAEVDIHLASCRQCTALLAGVVRTVAEVSAFIPDTGVTEATPSRTRRTVLVALGAAAAVLAVVVVPSLVRPWLERDAGLVSLVDSVGEQRSVLGRLSGGFPHAPLSAPSAGGQDGQAAGTDRVLLTAGRIRESFGELATPSRLHAMGVSQLLAGRYDDAVQSLLAASREQPANAQYLSDVAAVQLERARLGLRPDDLPRALAAADRARRLDPSLKEAWFNRALAVSALSLTDQARSAWTEYLKRDSASPWATEARARLEELSKPTPAAAWAAIEGRLEQSIDASTADAAVRAQTTEARNFIENTMLFVEWASAVQAGSSGARRARSRAGDGRRDVAWLQAMPVRDDRHRDRAAERRRRRERFAAHLPGVREGAGVVHQRSIRGGGNRAQRRPPAAGSGGQSVDRDRRAATKPPSNMSAVTTPRPTPCSRPSDRRRRRGSYLHAAGRASWFRGLIAVRAGPAD